MNRYQSAIAVWFGLMSVLATIPGLELSMQYKLRPNSRLQPYGKIGVGVYGLEDLNTKVEKIGGGYNFALGVDYFFSRHFGLGAELMFKSLNYTRERVGHKNEFKDLPNSIDGDAVGYMVTLTVQ
jgi:opacity protein-like surface antigen